MPPRRAAFSFGRLATLAYVGAACLAAAQVAVALNEDRWLPGVTAALAYLLGGVLIAGLLNAIAAAVSRIDALSRQMSETAADQASAARRFVEQIEESMEAARRREQELSAPHAAAHDDLVPPGTSADGSPAPEPPRPETITAVMDDRVLAMLEEIRELALMNDEQRRARLHQHLETRKRNQLNEVFSHIKDAQWARADRALTALETQFPGDEAVRQARGEMLRLRDAREAEALREAQERAQDLMSVNSWDKALATAADFVENHPANLAGRQLMTRVRHEYEQHRETSFGRMYEDVQDRVDRREWRDALDAAQRLLDEFPAHARANKIRQQLAIIHENAEIEERHEQEMRIQSLVRGRRFAEAVQLAEEVIRKYPDSPQAIGIDQMLPRLRDLAEHGDDGEGDEAFARP